MKPGGVRLPPELQEAVLRVLDVVYDGRHSEELAIWLSPADERAFQEVWVARYPGTWRRQWHTASTYAELRPDGFLDMLWRIGAVPGDRFYDLGSGPGKLVSLAWLAGLHATGVELSRARWEAHVGAMAALRRLSAAEGLPRHEGLPRRRTMRSVCGDLLDVDFTDADVLFVNSVMFSKVLVAEIASIARWMRPGAVIISSHKFEGPEFGEARVMPQPTSWMASSDFAVQEVLRNPLDTEKRPAGVRRAEDFDVGSRCCFSDSI